MHRWAVQSPATLSSAFPWDGFFTITWGMAVPLGGVFSSAFSVLVAVRASIGEIGQDALASNRFVEAGMVLDHGVCSLFCGAVAVTAALGCCPTRGLLLQGWRYLLLLGAFLWDMGFP